MKRLRLEWSSFRKSLRVLKKNRRLWNLLAPPAVFQFLLTGSVLYLLMKVSAALAARHFAGITVPLLWLAAAVVPGIFLCRLISVFLLGTFFSEMIRGFGDEPILIKRGIFFTFIKRKALFRWAMKGILFSGKHAVFAIPTILCDEEAEDPSVIRERSVTTIEHIWHPKGGFLGFFWMKTIFCLSPWIPVFALLFLFQTAPDSRVRHEIVILLILLLLLFLLFGIIIWIAEKVYIAALFCYAHGPDTVGEFTREELKQGF